ncbi:MAG: siderophore-interacting protein [Pseudomonadota bacterium]
MTQENYPYEARADLPGVAFTAMRQMIMMQVKSAGLKVLEDTQDTLTVETNHGLIGLRPGDASETAGMVAAVDERWLFVMKNAVVAQMDHVMPDVAKAMRWSNGPTEGSLPPNFCFVQAEKVEQLGPVFYRVTLKGEDLSAYGNDAIHFRLVQPPVGQDPAWPSVAANGSVVWPDGPGAPHKPVYTARAVDHDQNTLITDVFIHDGGRTTAWAEEVMSGKRGRKILGLMGPSGGGLMDADKVLLATDETGFPAAARILENLPDGASGEILLEAEQGADCNYPIAIPSGIKATWLSRAHGDRLVDHSLAALGRNLGAKVWFAGERQDARTLRDAAKDAGWDKADLRISGFWAAPARE